MKDELGHGSNKRGMAHAGTAGNHQSGVLRVGRPFVVSSLRQAPNPPGKVLGLWKTEAKVGDRDKPAPGRGNFSRGRAVAERIAQGMRTDSRDAIVRVR